MCPYNDARSDRLHDGANVTIHGIQTASAAAKTDDPVTFYFDFEDLGLKDNTVRAQLFTTDSTQSPKPRTVIRKCTPPTGTTYIATATGSNTDKSEDLSMRLDVPGATLSLWNKEKTLKGRGDN